MPPNITESEDKIAKGVGCIRIAALGVWASLSFSPLIISAVSAGIKLPVNISQNFEKFIPIAIPVWVLGTVAILIASGQLEDSIKGRCNRSGRPK